MTTRSANAHTMPTAELLARLGAVTAEDARALAAVEAGTVDLLDFDANLLSPLYRGALADALAGNAAVTAADLLATIRRRATWTHEVPKRIAATLTRYTEWMRVAAQQAQAAADAEIDDDYAIEAGFAQQFAGDTETATTAALEASTATPATLIVDLLAVVDTAAACGVRRAQALCRTAQDAITKKLHGLHHAALLAARIAQQALVPAF